MNRLFVAAYPPPDAARAMLATLDARSLAPHALSHPEQVHVTLQFIGDTPARDLDETLESVRRAASGAPSMTLQPVRLITLPEKGPPRLVAIESTAPPTLLELQQRLARRLARNVKGQTRDVFLPHLTLCRFRQDARAERIHEPVTLPPFGVHAIRVMRSLLRSGGAVHEVVEEISLA